MNAAAAALGGIALAAGLIYAGWYARGIQAEAQWLKYQAQKTREVENQRLQIQQLETLYAEQMEKARLNYSNEKLELDKRYRELVAELDSLRLQQRTAGAGAADDVPKSATAAIGAGTASQCRPHGADADRFKRLSERALKITKECDAMALRYNTLLWLYRQVQDKNNHTKN